MKCTNIVTKNNHKYLGVHTSIFPLCSSRLSLKKNKQNKNIFHTMPKEIPPMNELSIKYSKIYK